MKRWLLFSSGSLLLSLASLNLHAESRVSVAQLDQIIALLKAASDSDAAQRLSDLQLTERLSVERLTALNQLLSGEKSRHALRAIARGVQDYRAKQKPPNGRPRKNCGCLGG